jgi:ABC-type polar amino acid transport system ATPase subunit
MVEPLLSVIDLEVHRGRSVVLKGCDLAIDRGEPYAIVGESGSGKTTLLMAVLGLLPIAKGTVRVDNRDLPTLPPADRAQLAGMVFQDYQLFPHMTVLDNVMLAPRLSGRADGLEKRTRDILGDLGIGELAGRYPHELSGGQKQRAAIARSMVVAPKVLFFDEPSAALDHRTTDELATLLQTLNVTSQVIVVSHDWPFIERCCPRGASMKDGVVERTGALAELREP